MDKPLDEREESYLYRDMQTEKWQYVFEGDDIEIEIIDKSEPQPQKSQE